MPLSYPAGGEQPPGGPPDRPVSAGTAPAEPVDGLPCDLGGNGVPTGELPVRHVVSVVLQCGDDPPAGPPDRQDVDGVAVGDARAPAGRPARRPGCGGRPWGASPRPAAGPAPPPPQSRARPARPGGTARRWP